MIDIKSRRIDIGKSGVVFFLALKSKDERGEGLQHTVGVDSNLKRVHNSAKTY